MHGSSTCPGGNSLKEANGDVLLDAVAFHDWTDYNGVAHFRIFLGKIVRHVYG